MKKLLDAAPESPGCRDAWACCGDHLGELFRDRGEFVEAETTFREVIETYQGLLGGASGDTEPTVAKYSESLAVCQSHLGQTLQLSGKPQEADQAFAAAIARLSELAARSPLHQDKLAFVYEHRGVLLRDQGKPEEALAEFRRAKELRVQLASAPDAAAEHRAHLAWFLVNCPQPEFRDPPQAIRLATTLTAEIPSNADYRNILGAAWYRAGDSEKAIEALRHADRLRGSEHARDWFFLAMAYWKADRRQEAEQAYRRGEQWLQSNQPHHAELQRIRQEAVELLGGSGARPQP
jgi:tetratricopeptide (TPR) repeat protein